MKSRHAIARRSRKLPIVNRIAVSASRCNPRSAGKTSKVAGLTRLARDISILIIWADILAERGGDVVERMT
jgi:hypothetical protein